MAVEIDEDWYVIVDKRTGKMHTGCFSNVTPKIYKRGNAVSAWRNRFDLRENYEIRKIDFLLGPALEVEK